METKQYLNDYYQQYDEDGRLRGPHGMVEFLTTMRYVEKYLTPGCRVLEIGAGTGRYSHALARQGYAVDAVELVPHNIEVFKRNTEPGERVTVVQGDAVNLEGFGNGTYDVTLLLGPMYHLYTEEEQRAALSEALRVTKSGGVVFAAYCGNDATIIQFCFGKGRLAEEHYRNLIDPVTFKATSNPEELFQLYRREDIDALMEGLPVVRLHYVGTDMVTNYMREVVDGLDEDMYRRFLDYHFAICERRDMVGISHHILDIFRKD